MYGSESWGFEDISQIEVFYRKKLRNIFKLNKSTASCIVYGETGRYKLTSVVGMRMVNFWCRLLVGKQTKLSCMMYKLMKVMHESDEISFRSKWITKVKGLLDMSGLGNVWLEQEHVNVNWLKSALELRLRDIDKQNWHGEVQENSQCVIYRIFKENLEFEPYLTQLSDNDRINLCKFRCSSHRLPCVTGRYANIPRSERICNLCNLNVMGDEFHFVFQCPFF